MQQKTLEFFQTWKDWPAWVIQNTGCTDQYVTYIVNDAAIGQIFNFYVPSTLLTLPFSLSYLMFSLNELLETVILREGIEIPKDFFTCSVYTGEVWIRLKTVGVIMSREVARNPEQRRRVSDVQVPPRKMTYPGYRFSNQTPAIP